jgi:hypothetical protein
MLARRHDPDLDLEAILDHLAGVSVFADEDFAEYGLDEPRVADLRSWPQDGTTTSPAASSRSLPTMNFPTTYDSIDRGAVRLSGPRPVLALQSRQRMASQRARSSPAGSSAGSVASLSRAVVRLAVS